MTSDGSACHPRGEAAAVAVRAAVIGLIVLVMVLVLMPVDNVLTQMSLAVLVIVGPLCTTILLWARRDATREATVRVLRRWGSVAALGAAVYVVAGLIALMVRERTMSVLAVIGQGLLVAAVLVAVPATLGALLGHPRRRAATQATKSGQPASR